ncbi:response regulator [Paenibacillus gansuensis]|uniref:Response regulator n=1 Tax=Paenibacillus gansuensis TaxID=306542 RepID=A0ABW5PEX9_9BACL
MYNVLIVDDEWYAIKAIQSGVQWPELQVNHVYEAGSADEARSILAAKPVDVMISDIEMPGESGLELQEWVREHYPRVETIFLTCHSDFQYAREALRLGSLEYLLKPVNFGELGKAVRKALEQVRLEQELDEISDNLQRYSSQWNNQLPLLIERLWQDILKERIPLSPQSLESSFRMYGIPLERDSEILPIMISIEEWKQEFSSRDEEILEYAMRRAAEEIILDGYGGAVILDRDGINFVILYLNKQKEVPQGIKERCRAFIRTCEASFYSRISCYIGERTAIPGIVQSFRSLENLERGNVTQRNTIIEQVGSPAEPKQSVPVSLPEFKELAALFEAGQEEELLSHVRGYFQRISKEPIDLNRLISIHNGFRQMIYSAVDRKGLSVSDIYRRNELNGDSRHVKSLQDLERWTLEMLSIGCAGFKAVSGESDSSVIRSVQAHLQNHLAEPFSRDALAELVYLNPAYLSRLFKKETGISLSDYLIGLRMEKSKELLMNSSFKIQHIAAIVGYESFPHFTRLFKKTVGISPLQFRRNHRILSE